LLGTLSERSIVMRPHPFVHPLTATNTLATRTAPPFFREGISAPFHLVAKERCTSSHPNSFVSLINFAQCGLWLKYSATSSAVASWLPPPPIKEPPCIEYSPNRFLFTQEMSGEVRIVMLS
jgi:hypothetical protein